MTSAWIHYAVAGRAWTRLFLAMPDHLHALISFLSEERMTEVIRDWKRFITRSAHITWQDGFFDHRLRNESALDEKAAYIRNNPVRKGLILDAAQWPFIWSVCGDEPAR